MVNMIIHLYSYWPTALSRLAIRNFFKIIMNKVKRKKQKCHYMISCIMMLNKQLFFNELMITLTRNLDVKEADIADNVHYSVHVQDRGYRSIYKT